MQLVISWSTGEKAISEAFDDALQKKEPKVLSEMCLIFFENV